MTGRLGQAGVGAASAVIAAAVCLAAGLPPHRGGAIALLLSVLVASRWAGRVGGYAATLVSAILAVALVAVIGTPDGVAVDIAGLALLALLGVGIASWIAPRTPAATERAADPGRLKEEFLATVSHELRTPLNAILGWTELLRVPRAIPAHQIEHGLEVIERNARRQLALVEELIAAAEPDTAADVWECLDLRAMLRALVHGLEPAATMARIALASDESPSPASVAAGAPAAAGTDPVWVQGHAASLRIALRHILDNAIKYTPAGGQVHTCLRQSGDRVMIFVSDTGAGIAAAQIERVFEPFSQQEMSAARAHGGLGLGLTIARRLIERHGGHLDLRSEGPAQGATALITLPAATHGPG